MNIKITQQGQISVIEITGKEETVQATPQEANAVECCKKICRALGWGENHPYEMLASEVSAMNSTRKRALHRAEVFENALRVIDRKVLSICSDGITSTKMQEIAGTIMNSMLGVWEEANAS